MVFSEWHAILHHQPNIRLCSVQVRWQTIFIHQYSPEYHFVSFFKSDQFETLLTNITSWWHTSIHQDWTNLIRFAILLVFWYFFPYNMRKKEWSLKATLTNFFSFSRKRLVGHSLLTARILSNLMAIGIIYDKYGIGDPWVTMFVAVQFNLTTCPSKRRLCIGRRWRHGFSVLFS